jgi:hypothetical protein
VAAARREAVARSGTAWGGYQMRGRRGRQRLHDDASEWMPGRRGWRSGRLPSGGDRRGDGEAEAATARARWPWQQVRPRPPLLGLQGGHGRPGCFFLLLVLNRRNTSHHQTAARQMLGPEVSSSPFFGIAFSGIACRLRWTKYLVGIRWGGRHGMVQRWCACHDVSFDLLLKLIFQALVLI